MLLLLLLRQLLLWLLLLLLIWLSPAHATIALLLSRPLLLLH